MRTLLLLPLLAFACVGPAPQPCTTCGSDKCVDTATDPQNCGACNKACAAGQICTAGQCKPNCPQGQVSCGSQCVDTQSDNRHCGDCNRPCAAGTTCGGGTCTPSCASPTMACGSACVNPQNDPAHCGGCNRPCDAGVCSSGACKLTCDSPLTECPNRACVDLRNDPNNCMSCGRACAPLGATAATCSSGACGYEACRPGFADCDADRANGCETPRPTCVQSQLVSHSLDGGAGNAESSYPQVSSDGRFVVFLSRASNLVAGDPDQRTNVFLWDSTTNLISAVDYTADGGWPAGEANWAKVTPSGRHILFGHTGRDLLSSPLPAGAWTNLFVRDRMTGALTLATVGPDGGPIFNPALNEIFGGSVSEDGRYVAFSTRTPLDPRATNGEHHCYLRDLVANTLSLVSVSTSGAEGVSMGYGANAFNPVLSGDGRFVAWASAAGYPTDNNSCFDVWVRNIDAGTTVKATPSGACSTSAATANVDHFVGSTLVHTGTFSFSALDTNSAYDLYTTDLNDGGVRWLTSNHNGQAATSPGASGYWVSGGVSSDLRYASVVTNYDAFGARLGNGAYLYVKDLITTEVQQANFPVVVSTPGGVRSAHLAGGGRAVVWDCGDTLWPGDINNQFDVFWRRLR